MLVAYDHGNNFGKDSAGNIFENGYQVSLYPTGAFDELFYEGKYYIFGNRAAVNMEKTKGDRMMVCTLYSLGLQFCKNKTDAAKTQQVVLGVDIPISRFGAERQAYKEYYEGKTKSFTFREKDWIVYFDEVHVYPQGFIIWATQFDDESIKDDDSTVTLDIGGYTTDIVWIKKDLGGIPRVAKRTSFDHGMVKLYNRINEQLQAVNIHADEFQIARAIQGKEFSDMRKEEIKKVTVSCTEQFVQELMDMIAENDISLNVPYLLGGGGSEALKGYMKNLNITKSLGIFANANAVLKKMEIDRKKNA